MAPRARYSNLTLSRRVLAQAMPHAPQLLVILLVDLAATPLMLLNPLPLKVAVDSVLANHPLPPFLAPLIPFPPRSGGLLLTVAALQVLVIVLAQAQQMLAHVLRTRVGEAMTLRFRERLFIHAQRLSLEFHDSQGTTDSLYRIEYDAAAVHYLVVYAFLTTLAAAFSLVATFFVIARIDVRLAAIAILVAPVMALLAIMYDRWLRPLYTTSKELESGAMEIVQEVLSSLRVVKAFGREQWEADRFQRQSREGVVAKVRTALAEGGFGILVNGTTAVGTAAVLFLGIQGVEAGRLTLGELLVVISYLAQLYAPLETVTTEVAGMQSSLASAERAFQILDEPTEVRERPNAIPIRRSRGEIEFQRVSFAYEGGPEVLHDVSFRIPAGGWLGIAGHTGAGKTTLVSLLTRLHDPTAGRILLDGLDLRDYRLIDLRRQFTLVLQETTLFSGSIGDNIAYGASRPQSQSALETAAADANAHEFISALPDSYRTLVGEKGMLLSGGERQRIGLARAFVRDAPILILDEPTSSVDVRTEAAIVDAMRRLMVGRTAIMIAHRLSTLDMCDFRLELDHGRVVGWATKTEQPVGVV